MRERAKRLVVAGLDRAIAHRGLKGPEAARTRSELVAWARNRARAAGGRRRLVAGRELVVTGPGRAELRPFELPLAGPGEVTIELCATAVSPGTETAQWLRLPNAQPPFPYRPGYSGAGRVLAAGAGVGDLAPGDLVAAPRVPHASLANVPAAWVSSVPGGVPVEQAALVYLAIIAGYGVRRAGPLADERVCVLGAGPIGALALRLAALQAPAELVAIARTRRRERQALAGGASRFVTVEEPLERLGATAVIEATGDPAAIAPAIAAARPGGTVVLLGSPRGTSEDAGFAALQAKRLRLVGAHISSLATLANREGDGSDPFAELAGEYLGALAAGRLEAADLAGEAADPREAGLLYDRLARGELGAAHFDWSRLERRVTPRRLLAGPRLEREPAPFAAPPVLRPRAGGAPLRFALVGCGDIGLANARAIAAARGAELAVAHDPAPGLAEAVAAELGCDVAPQLAQALDRERADAAFISVPHDLHAPLAAEAARSGLHVVLEKPLAADLDGGREAVAAAAAAGVALTVCFAFRYHRPIQSARALLASGAFGELRGVNLVFHTEKPAAYWQGGFSGRARSDWRASRERAGGGVLIMNLTHYLDLVRYLTGAEPAWVAGATRSEAGAEVEDAIALSVGWGEGAIGALSASASTRGGSPNRFELWTEHGTIRLEPEARAYCERAGSGLEPGRWTPLSTEDEGDVRALFVERFAAAVRAGGEPDVTARDALGVQAFVAAAYRAAATGERVAVEAPEAGT